MESLKTEFIFDAAHRLNGYPSKCSNIHGHTYRVVFEIQFEDVDVNSAPFFMDFKNFKGLLKNEIEHWDHKLILYKGDSLILGGGLIGAYCGLVTFHTLPTAENMAYFLVEAAKKNYQNYKSPKDLEGWEYLTAGGVNRPCTFIVTVYETPTNAATVTMRFDAI